MNTTLKRSILIGIAAAAALLALYLGVITILSGWSEALRQFARFQYLIITVVIGFGLQMGLYTSVRELIRQHHARMSRNVVAASGTTSGLTMVACCAHYVPNILPFVAAAGFFTALANYQEEFFLIGILANALGIIYLLRSLHRIKHRYEQYA